MLTLATCASTASNLDRFSLFSALRTPHPYFIYMEVATVVAYLQKVQLFFYVCEDLYCRSHFLFQFNNIFIPLFNLFIQVHIVDFKLFKVDHVQSFSQLVLRVQQLHTAPSGYNHYTLPQVGTTMIHCPKWVQP